MSPEAPVPIMTSIEKVITEGMSGNVVRNLQALSKDISIHHIHQKNSISKTRFVDRKSNHMFLRLDIGDDEVEQFNAFDDLLNTIKNADILIVSDYYKGFLSDDDLILLGKSAKLSILDSKRKLDKDIIESFTFIKLNEKELANNLHFSQCKNIIATLGDKGASFRGKLYPSKSPKQTIDVSGAGDTFTASFIFKYHLTKDTDVSINFANEMSSLVVSKRGIAVPEINKSYD
jgi:bifunctional ADP-heptose synthase (sugar kinase/adenylyltransferase)